MNRSVRAVAAAALVAGVLSGCFYAGPVGGVGPTSGGGTTAEPVAQTLREACDQLLPTMLSLNEDLNAAYAVIATDPSQASPLLRALSEEFRSAIAELSNDEVVEVTTTAADSLDAMIDEIDKAMAGEQNAEALQAAGADVQTDFTAIDTVCKPA